MYRPKITCSFCTCTLPKSSRAEKKHTEVVEYHPIEWMGQGGARHDYRFGSYGCRSCSKMNGACELVCKMIVDMEGLSVEFQILGKHCAQLLCHSNGTRAVVVRPV